MIKADETEKFAVGDGATELLWSDSRAYTVIEVSKSGRRIKIQRDKATLLNKVGSGEPDALEFQRGGFVGHTSGAQRYDYKPDPSGSIIEASLRNNGRWVVKGETAKGGRCIKKGRHEHYDFNF